MWIFLLIPFLLVPFLRWGVPLLGTYWPVMRAYDVLVIGMIIPLITISPAMLTALLMLDEKDQGILDVLRVMPVSSRTFFGYRIGLLAVLGSLLGGLSLALCGLWEYHLGHIMAISLLLALYGPLIPLLIISLANNKIEGVTLVKAINVAMGVPVMLILLAPSWEIVSGIIPFYWLYKILGAIHQGESMVMYWVAGMGTTFALFCIAYSRFSRKVFRPD